MRSANLLNDFAFKYVFGEDCKEANDALKSLLTVFLERSVNKVVVKNSEIVKDYSKMKSPRLDLLVEFDDRTMVDLEMQLRQTKDNLPIRFSYYLARLHGSQELEGKYYGELKETIVLVFFNVNLIENDKMCNTFTLKNEDGLSFVEESQDRMKLRTVEMAKLDLNKPLKDMNEQEKMIYYFLNCHKGMEDSKIKVMIESVFCYLGQDFAVDHSFRYELEADTHLSVKDSLYVVADEATLSRMYELQIAAGHQ